jgi:hypothetical protein
MNGEKDIRHAWTIDGRKIKSIMDLHHKCRIVVVSASSTFKGLFTQNSVTKNAVTELKPKPISWVNRAVNKWSTIN